MAIGMMGSDFHADTEVRDAQGNIIPPPPRSTFWHESFRYYRLSQTTDDLFDAYRNVYLALESVLSTISPQKVNAATGRIAEQEGQWFERALTDAGNVTN